MSAKEFTDWNKFTLDQHCEILENEFRFSSSGIAKSAFELIRFYKDHKPSDGNSLPSTESKLNLADVTNSLPDLTLDEADVLAKETDYACYACEDTEEINWGDASAFFIEGYQYAIKKFRQ